MDLTAVIALIVTLCSFASLTIGQDSRPCDGHACAAQGVGHAYAWGRDLGRGQGGPNTPTTVSTSAIISA